LGGIVKLGPLTTFFRESGSPDYLTYVDSSLLNELKGVRVNADRASLGDLLFVRVPAGESPGPSSRAVVFFVVSG
jgi:hypothetical protein